MTATAPDLTLYLHRLTSADPQLREPAAAALGDLLRFGALDQDEAEQAIGRLVAAAVAGHPGADAETARNAVAEATAYRPPLRLVRPLAALATPDDLDLLDEVLGVIASTRDPAAAAVIRPFQEDPRTEVRAVAARALAELAGRIPGELPSRYVTWAYANRWAGQVAADLDRFTATFEADRGWPCGEHAVGGQATSPELTALTAGELRHVMPSDLLVWHGRIREVRLPDVGAGYFLHPPALVAAHATGEGVRWVQADGGRDRVVVFGSDGGGTLYALRTTGTAVYRLPPGEVVGGVYRGAAAVVAPHLVGFLDLLRAAVHDHVRRGVTPVL